MAKANTTAAWTPKPKKKLRRHTKHQNKHKSCKPTKGQG